MKNFNIYGAGGHAKVVIEILEKSNNLVNTLYEDNIDKDILFNYKISNKKSVLWTNGVLWIIAIGDNQVRRNIAEQNALEFGVAIDKNAHVSKRTEIGEGTVVMPGAIINSSAKVGSHVIVNTNASVDHDCVIGNYVHISPHATLCGGVTVGEGAHVGAGSVVIPNIKIGKWAQIGAGTVVINDVPENTTVVGNPARIITKTDERYQDKR